MEAFMSLAHGLSVAIQPMSLLFALIGVLLGTAVGVLPGIGPALTVALLLPITSQLEPTAAFIMFGGIYYGAMYGGSTTAILLNTPGESGSIVTAIDGKDIPPNTMANTITAMRGPVGSTVTLSPQDSSTRAQIAQMLYNFFK